MALKRRLDSRLTLYKERSFPSRETAAPRLRYEAVVGVGGNIGDVRRRFRHLLFFLKRSSKIELHATAPILQNPPFGYLEQPDFFNTVVLLTTSMQPREFLHFLLRVEKRFGRRRSFPNAPRTLDLDLLFFDGRVIKRPDLTVPHPHWHKRESVVIPLSYLGTKR